MKANKPFWFAFNTADWLSSKSVRMMSLAERGAYIGLLATAWGEDQPGTLPADEETVRRLSEISAPDWVVSGRVILAQFPLSECGTFRYNPRLLDEAEKREQLSEKKAEAGRKSAERRATLSTQRQQTANTNPTGVENPATGVGENGNQLQSQLQLQSSNEDEKASAPAKTEQVKSLDPAKQTAVALTDPADLQHWSEGPLTKPKPFQVICERLGFLGIDFEFYRKQALVAAEDADTSRTIKQWSSWIRNYLNNQLDNGPLRKPSAGMPTEPTPKNDYQRLNDTGGVIAIKGVGTDEVMNRQLVATYQNAYPKATIHAIR